MERGVYFHAQLPKVRRDARLSLHPSASRAPVWTRPGRISVAGLVLASLMLLACLPVILSGTTRGRAAYDSLNYHEKAIRQFAQELPKPRLDDYLSATTPGYHLVLAAVGRNVDGIGTDGVSAYDKNITPTPPDPRIESERRVLQFAGLGFTLALLYLVGHWSERRVQVNTFEPGAALATVCLALPLIGSPYIYQSAAWLLPDNSAWLGVVAILLLALRPQLGVFAIATMGLVLVWLVAARQIHVWAAGLIWAAAWLSSSLTQERSSGELLAVRDVLPRGRTGAILGRLAIAVLCTLPAARLLEWFWALWSHQLVPPTFTTWHRAGIQGATPAFVLSLIALFAVFFASWLRPGAMVAWRDHRGWLIGAALAGLALAVLPPTAWDFDHGRFGGVWELYKRAGAIGGRSLALMVLAPLGGMVVVATLAGLAVRERWVMLAALAGFAVANCANPQLWQRYHEPFVLVWLIIGCAAAAGRMNQPDAQGATRLWKLAGPVALTLILSVVNAWLVLRTEPQIDKGYRLGNIETPPAQVPQGERRL